ncbi:MAG: helix-turn-helix transcriptional regulator [bacterium]
MDSNAKVAGFGPGEMVAPGAALCGLRRRAGLSLVELAHLVGRELGFCSHLSRLEHGRLRRPTPGLIADYLRACGALRAGGPAASNRREPSTDAGRG